MMAKVACVRCEEAIALRILSVSSTRLCNPVSGSTSALSMSRLSRAPATVTRQLTRCASRPNSSDASTSTRER